MIAQILSKATHRATAFEFVLTTNTLLRSAKTQRDSIRAALANAKGTRVPLAGITRLASQYDVRMFELHRLGHRVTNLIEEIRGLRYSRFRPDPGPSPSVASSHSRLGAPGIHPGIAVPGRMAPQ